MAAPVATLAASLIGPATATPSSALRYHGSTGRQRIELTGASTYNVDLAMMPSAGLRGLLVELDTVDADGAAVTAPVTMTWTSNGVEKSEELSADPVHEVGGFFALASPSPVNGITGLSITSSANALVYVTALG